MTITIVRAAYAAFHAATIAKHAEPHEVVRQLYPNDEAARTVLLRSAAAVVDTAAVAAVVQTATRDFLASLAPRSAAARLMSLGVTAPSGPAGLYVWPQRTSAPTAGSYVAEDAPIPVRAFPTGGAQVAPRKIGILSAISRELTIQASGETIVEAMLKEDAAVSVDAAYFGTSDPGLLYGVTPTAGSDVLMTMQLLAASIAAGGSGQVVFVVSPDIAAAFPIRAPTVNATVWPSLACPSGRIVAIDPMSIVHVVGDVLDVSASLEAVLHMSDAPLEVVSATGPTTASPVRSMYQTDAVAIRLLLDVGFAKRRSGAVAYADAIQW